MAAAEIALHRVFFVRWSEMGRWVLPTSAIMGGPLRKGWTTAKVGDVVRLVADRVQVNPDCEYKMAGVRWYGEGLFHRETVRGNKMSAKYVAPLKPRALIYNRLFAWKASFAVVPPELADCNVSNEFPQFISDSSRVLPEYLYLWSITGQTIRGVNAASTGSAAVSRNRFREEFFLEFELPLPPLETQSVIVAVWQQTQTEIAETRKRIADLEHKIEVDFLSALGLTSPKRAELPKIFGAWWKDLERWSVMYNQLASVSVDISSGFHPVSTLGNVATVSYGIQKCPANRPGQHARPYLRVANVQRGELDLHEVKKINVPDSEMQTFRLEAGDLLVCEGNSADLVGRPAIWRGEIPDCVHQNHILKARVDHAKVFPEYVLEYMQTNPARTYFRSRAKFTTNLASINSNDLRGLPIPVPPLNVQQELVDKVSDKRQEIAALKVQAGQKTEQAKADVEAMILGVKPAPTGA
jgi:type I restriction enzyme, S subunit